MGMIMETELNKGQETEAIQKGKPLGWGKALLFIVMFVVFSAILSIVVGTVTMILDITNGTNTTEAFLNRADYLILLDAAAFLIALLIFKSVRQFLKGGFSFAPLKKGKTYLYLVSALVVNFVLQYLILDVLKWEDGADQIDTFGLNHVSLDWLSLTILFLGFAVITPIKEEILYRGVLHGFLNKKVNFWVGLIVSSLIFGVLHVGHALSATLMGMVFVLLYKRTRTLIVPILFHIIWNFYAVSGLVYLVSKSA